MQLNLGCYQIKIDGYDYQSKIYQRCIEGKEKETITKAKTVK